MKNVVQGLEGKMNHSNHKNQINHSSDILMNGQVKVSEL